METGHADQDINPTIPFSRAGSAAVRLCLGGRSDRSSLVAESNLRSRNPLITSNPVELIGLTAQIPRQQDFDQAGIERLEFLSKLRFSVQTPPGGPNVIKVTID
jgi:hypothetical protein